MRSNVARFCVFAVLAFSAPIGLARAAEPAPGDACTALNYIAVTGGPETTGVRNILRCNGTTWQLQMTIDATGKVGIGTSGPIATLDNAGSFALSGDIPATIAANTDNWAPANHLTASVIRMTAASAFNITGLTGGADGRVITLLNIGAGTLTLKNSVTSTVTNQFLFTGDLALATNESATLMYDSTASRWKLLAKGSATAGGGATTIDALTDAYTIYDAGTTSNMIMGRAGATALAAGAIQNMFIGESAGATAANSTAATDNNIAIGYGALAALTTGDSNTAIGVTALSATTTAMKNTAVGFGSMYLASAGDENTALGAYTMYWGTTGSSNTAIGAGAMGSGSTGSYNTGVGSSVMNGVTSGGSNTALGNAALISNQTGNGNTAIGRNALQSIASADDNTAIGSGALQVATGPYNIALGSAAGATLSTGARNIIIGQGIEAASNTASNQLNIGNLIYGTALDGTATTISTGNIGIGVKSPPAKFVVAAPAAETIAAAATITANACGTVKLITATAARTTNTTNTFTSPTSDYAGCCMDVINTGAFNITLDANAKFKVQGAPTDQVLGTSDTIRVCSDGASWYQMGAVSANQ